ncbi:MAG: hypothetical protein V4722_01655 [Bacteroidota bacterium]
MKKQTDPEKTMGVSESKKFLIVRMNVEENKQNPEDDVSEQNKKPFKKVESGGNDRSQKRGSTFDMV